jgi:hypothetical protein
MDTKALGLAAPYVGSDNRLTAKAWRVAVGLAFPSREVHVLTPATPAPRPAKVTPPIKLPGLKGDASLVHMPCSAPDLSVNVQSPGPPRRRHHPTLVTHAASKAAQQAHSRRFKPLKLKASTSAKPKSILKKCLVHNTQHLPAEVCVPPISHSPLRPLRPKSTS